MYVCERQLAIRKLNFDSGRYRELVNGIGLDCSDRLAVDLDVLDLVTGIRLECEGNRLADVLECQLRFDRAVLANLQNLAQQLIDILFGADVRSAEPAVVVGSIAKRRVIRIVKPVGDFMRIVVDIVPDNHVIVVQCPVLESLIRMRSVDRVHPAGLLAVGELTQRVSAKAGRGIDGADVVAFRTDIPQACIAHGFGKEVINRSVLLQRIRFGGNPRDVFGQIAVGRQVNILRCFERADETECDFNITRFYSIEISNSFFIDGRDTLAGFRSVHIRLCLLENACEFLLCGGTVLLGFVVQKIIIVRFQCLVLIYLLLLQNCLVRSFGSGQGIVVFYLCLVSSRELVVGIACFRNRVIAGFIDIANPFDHVNDFLHACVFTLHDVGHIVQTLASVYIAVIRNKRVCCLFGRHLINSTSTASAWVYLNMQETASRFVRVAQEVRQNADPVVLESAVGLCITKRGQRDNDLCGGFRAAIIAAQLILRGQPSNSLIHGILGICIGSVVRSQRLHDHCRRVNIIARMIAVDIPCAVGMLVGVKRLDPRFTRRIAGRILVVAAGIQCNQCKSCTIISLFGDSVSTA